jgi:hypothetical protein
MKSILLFAISLLISAFSFAQCSELFISEYVHAYGNDRAIEIYNPTNQAVNLNGYMLVRYSNGGTTPSPVGLSHVLPSAECWVAVSDKRDTNGVDQDTVVSAELQAKADTFLCPVYTINKMMYFNGDDVVTLEKTNGVYVDIIGKIGQDPGIAWTADTLNGFTSAGGARWWTKRQTLVRKYGIQQGITTNPNYFNPAAEWDSLGVRVFSTLGWHQNQCQPNGIISSQAKQNDCFFYPNPSTTGFFLVKGTEIIQSVEMINMVGQSVLFEENSLERGDMKVITNDLEKGVYMVSVKFADGSIVSKKVIIK